MLGRRGQHAFACCRTTVVSPFGIVLFAVALCCPRALIMQSAPSGCSRTSESFRVVARISAHYTITQYRRVHMFKRNTRVHVLHVVAVAIIHCCCRRACVKDRVACVCVCVCEAAARLDEGASVRAIDRASQRAREIELDTRGTTDNG